MFAESANRVGHVIVLGGRAPHTPHGAMVALVVACRFVAFLSVASRSAAFRLGGLPLGGLSSRWWPFVSVAFRFGGLLWWWPSSSGVGELLLLFWVGGSVDHPLRGGCAFSRATVGVAVRSTGQPTTHPDGGTVGQKS